MTYLDDWRRAPDPQLCIACTATLAGCQNRRGFSGRSCCPSCYHQPEPETAA